MSNDTYDFPPIAYPPVKNSDQTGRVATTFQISCDPPPPEPEPVIGPGMILERGRERWIVAEESRPKAWWMYQQRRGWFGGWGTPRPNYPECYTFIRLLLLSGFRVIRQADPEKPSAIGGE